MEEKIIDFLKQSDKTISNLISQFEDNSFRHHAFLINSKPFGGQLIFAKYLAKLALGLKENSNELNLFIKKSHPDFHYFEDSQKPFLLEEASLITNKASISPHGNIHVVLVENIERMNKESANKLLKTIEEPTSNTIFIFTTSHLGNVIGTIKSRLYTINLPEIPSTLFVEEISNIANSYETGNLVSYYFKDKIDLINFLHHLEKKDIEIFLRKLTEIDFIYNKLFDKKISITEKALLTKFLYKKDDKEEDTKFSKDKMFFIFFESYLDNLLKNLNKNQKSEYNNNEIANIYKNFIELSKDFSNNINKKLAFEYFLLSSFK